MNKLLTYEQTIDQARLTTFDQLHTNFAFIHV